MNLKVISSIFFITLFCSCQEEQYIPKPPTYLRLELPEHKYVEFNDPCPFQFESSKLFNIKPMHVDPLSCSKEIDLGPLNGTMYMHYWNIEKPLSFYVNSANDEIDRHKIKATSIIDGQIIHPKEKVYGTFFEIQGDVATPFQFYLTDSADRFVYCEILFNSTPNYDSLKPTLDYLRVDLDHLIKTFEWK